MEFYFFLKTHSAQASTRIILKFKM